MGKGTKDDVMHPYMQGRVFPRVVIVAAPYRPYAVPIQTARPADIPTKGAVMAAARVCFFHTKAKAVGKVPGLVLISISSNHSDPETQKSKNLPYQDPQEV